MALPNYFNQFLPLSNNPGMVAQRAVGLSTTPTSIDMRTLFGAIDNGDFFAFKADAPLVSPTPSGPAWRAYFSISARPETINNGWAGPVPVASGLNAWPLADQAEKIGKLMGAGRGVGTGFATMMDYRTLNAMCTAGSGYLRIQRLTLPDTADASKFKIPVPSGIFPPGPSGWTPVP